jgi:hypothetical protein
MGNERCDGLDHDYLPIRTIRFRYCKQKKIVAKVLTNKFEKDFNTKRVIVGNQTFSIDLMSADGSIAVKIVIESGITSQGKISSAKFQSIISAMLVLNSLRCERKLVIFTNQHMYEEFIKSITKMPESISNTTQGIEVAVIPLYDVDDGDFFENTELNWQGEIRRIQ